MPSANIHTITKLEDESLTDEERAKSSTGGRYYRRSLGNMQGSFLTLLDEEGKIVLFLAGALRRRAAEEKDEVVSLTPRDIARGVFKVGSDRPYHPEYRVETLEGEARKVRHYVEFREVPALTYRLVQLMPEAVSWGVLQVNPLPGNPFDMWRPNGSNTELRLNGRSWKVVATADGGAVAGSGGNDFMGRLSERAWEMAQVIPSAWQLAVVAAHCFGGMGNLPPPIAMKPFPVVTRVYEQEIAIRAQRKAESQAGMIHRRARQDARGEMRQLEDALGVPVGEQLTPMEEAALAAITPSGPAPQEPIPPADAGEGS